MSRGNSDDMATEELDTAEFVSADLQISKFFEPEPRIRMRMEVAGKTHPGLVRPNNEDQYLAVRRYRGREVLASSLPTELLEPIDDHAFTLAVADGLGGQRFGEIASLLAMRTGWELGGDEIKWTVRLNENEIKELRQKAEVFCQLLDESLHAEIRDNPRLAGMATTLTLCYTTGPNLFTIHVGDSRAYLYRDGNLQQLTRDHTMGQELIDLGDAEPDSPQVRRFRHVLTNCIGGAEQSVSVDFEHHELVDGDLVLLCTDGLYDMVTLAEMADTLARNLPAADSCNALVEMALDRGGKDNVTVVVARFLFDGSR